MRVVELRPVRGRSREIWELELRNDEVILFDDLGFDDLGDEFLSMSRDEANRRIQLPSFWMSAKYIQIFDEKTNLFEFHPDKKALAALQVYLETTLREDAGARRKVKSGGWALALFGMFLLVAGGVYLTVEIMRGALLEPGRLRIASPFAPILCGLIFTAIGIGQVLKARRLDREQTEEKDFET